MDGLDVVSQKSMRALLEDLIDEKWCLLILCRQPEDVPKKSTHILILEKGALFKKGEKNLILGDNSVTNLMTKPTPRFDRLTSVLNRKPSYSLTDPLLSLKNVSVSYGDIRVLKNINWDNYHNDLPFNPSALSLYKWAPIAEDLKILDRKIVLNSVILKWGVVQKEFNERIKF